MNDELARSLLDEVRQMRKLLTLLAEPAIAARDAKLRDELRKIVGASPTKQKSVLLMDGSRTQKQIHSESTVHQGNLSTMVGELEKAGLLIGGKKQPKLAITIPSNFFETDAESS